MTFGQALNEIAEDCHAFVLKGDIQPLGKYKRNNYDQILYIPVSDLPEGVKAQPGWERNLSLNLEPCNNIQKKLKTKK